MIISFEKSAILREVQRLARGTRADKRTLLRVGYQAEFLDRVPILRDGKLGSLPSHIMKEIR
jgi:hypothetical protein